MDINIMPDWQIRMELPEKILSILNSNESEVKKTVLLEDLIIFIEKGCFLRDIEYTSRGSMKDTTFFWEKGSLIEIIKILPENLKRRVIPVVLDKIELMLPEEKRSFESLSIAKKITSIPHDRIVFRNLVKVVRDDLKQTKEFLLECIKNNYEYERVLRLSKLIPSDDYFNRFS
jgi:hypothetical protein